MGPQNDIPENRLARLAVEYRLDAPVALRVAFEIRGFTVLLGRSGTGKSSLLKALAGLLPARGTPWDGLAPEARPVGYLPQNAALFPHLSVLENVAYPLRGKQRFAQAQALLEGLGLGDYAPRRAAQLSGGEAQRVALARALARGAELLLLDEPSASLDSVTRGGILAWLRSTIKQHDLPAFVATHDHEVAAFADWLVLLAGGRIIQQGMAREVFNQPASQAAAELLGFENIWQDETGAYAVRAADIGIAAQGVPAIVLGAQDYGADLRVECTAPQPMSVLVKAGDRRDFAPGARIFLDFTPLRLPPA